MRLAGWGRLLTMSDHTSTGLPIDGSGAERLPNTLAAIDDGRRRGLHLGAQLYVSRRGEPLADLAAGWARADEPLTPDHWAVWLSATKPLTAVALARLWEAGALDLDDPIARHLPEFGAAGKGGITLRHALTHTGGFRMLEVGWPEASWDEIVARIAARKPEPRWVPGEKAGYHLTSSWFILGEVIRRLDGRPFARYVRAEVCEPLGMERSWIGMPAEVWRAEHHRLAPLYDTSGSGAPRERNWATEERTTRPSPGGNGRGPIRELGWFYEALLAGGIRNGRRLLTPQTVAALTAHHRVGLYDHTFRHDLDWGLGFIPDNNHHGADTIPYGYGRHASRRSFGHSGFRSTVGFADPIHGLVVALAFNGTPDEEPHRRRMQTALEAIYEDLELSP